MPVVLGQRQDRVPSTWDVVVISRPSRLTDEIRETWQDWFLHSALAGASRIDVAGADLTLDFFPLGTFGRLSRGGLRKLFRLEANEASVIHFTTERVLQDLREALQGTRRRLALGPVPGERAQTSRDLLSREGTPDMGDTPWGSFEFADGSTEPVTLAEFVAIMGTPEVLKSLADLMREGLARFVPDKDAQALTLAYRLPPPDGAFAANPPRVDGQKTAVREEVRKCRELLKNIRVQEALKRAKKLARPWKEEGPDGDTGASKTVGFLVECLDNDWIPFVRTNPAKGQPPFPNREVFLGCRKPPIPGLKGFWVKMPQRLHELLLAKGWQGFLESKTIKALLETLMEPVPEELREVKVTIPEGRAVNPGATGIMPPRRGGNLAAADKVLLGVFAALGVGTLAVLALFGGSVSGNALPEGP